jgi:hypothetical protein
MWEMEVQVTEKTDAEVFEMMEYLSWKLRCSSFRDDFLKAATEFGVSELGMKVAFAEAEAKALWASYQKRGMVETFQEYIMDKDICRMFCHAINQ